MRKGKFVAISAVSAALVAGGIYLVVPNSDASATTVEPKTKVSHVVDKPKPVSLVGTWTQTEKSTGDILAEAEISNVGSIQINLRTRDSSSIYWMGSFDTSKDGSKPFELTSLADPDAQKVMAKSLFGSQDQSKEFAYKNGELSYKFTMLGTTTTVRLTKQ